MHKALHPRCRQTVCAQKNESRLTSIEDSDDASILQQQDYIKKCRGRLKQYRQHKMNRRKISRKLKLEEKQLYGHFKQQTSEISHKKIWTWLKKGNLKRETESLIIAAQNNAIRTMSKQE